MYVHRFLLDKYTLCISKVDTNVEIVYQKKGKEMTDSVAENFSVFFLPFSLVVPWNVRVTFLGIKFFRPQKISLNEPSVCGSKAHFYFGNGRSV